MTNDKNFDKIFLIMWLLSLKIRANISKDVSVLMCDCFRVLNNIHKKTAILIYECAKMGGKI